VHWQSAQFGGNIGPHTSRRCRPDGATQKADPRERTLGRMLELLETAAARGAGLVVFPELAFTTFFPRWYLEGDALDQYFECSMPNPAVQRLFDRARALRVGFYIGYAEQTADRQRYNCSILVDRDGAILGRYRKVHLPGSVEPRADARFQQISCLSRRTGLVSRDHGYDDLQRSPLARILARPWLAGG